MLNSFLNMSLSSFSSLFEIAATINIAFVAAEQAKQYGSTLTKNFFQSGINIDRKFSERYARVDKETVDSLSARLQEDGYKIISGPRRTGDGYYESCVIAFEDNQIEITI